MNTVSVLALEGIESISTLEELSKAFESLASGSDGMPPDLLKQCKYHTPATITRAALSVLAGRRRTTGHTRYHNYYPLYKNKGDRSDCNNHRGIFLLSIFGKAFSRVMLVRLQKLAELVHPESQCRFRAHRSTVDMIFSLCKLQEICRQQQLSIYIACIDLTKASTWS